MTIYQVASGLAQVPDRPWLRDTGRSDHTGCPYANCTAMTVGDDSKFFFQCRNPGECDNKRFMLVSTNCADSFHNMQGLATISKTKRPSSSK